MARCLCSYPDLDPTEDDWASAECACGHVGDEHDKTGQCQVECACGHTAQPIEPPRLWPGTHFWRPCFRVEQWPGGTLPEHVEMRACEVCTHNIAYDPTQTYVTGGVEHLICRLCYSTTTRSDHLMNYNRAWNFTEGPQAAIETIRKWLNVGGSTGGHG